MDIGGTSSPQAMSAEDSARLAASSKRITIQPISEAIAVDALSSEQIAAEHATSPALANTPTDTEQTIPELPLQHVPQRRSGHVLAITFAVGVVIVAGGILFVAAQSL